MISTGYSNVARERYLALEMQSASLLQRLKDAEYEQTALLDRVQELQRAHQNMCRKAGALQGCLDASEQQVLEWIAIATSQQAYFLSLWQSQDCHMPSSSWPAILAVSCLTCLQGCIARHADQ